MSEKKMGKYVKYAIGEIVLVVIGILIALQINNWNIKSVNTQKERNYLAEINENLENDIARIDSVFSFNKSKKQAIFEILKAFSEGSIPNDAVIVGQRLNLIGQYDPFFPNDLGFQNLISAENIGLIKDDNLRKALLNYYNFDFKTGTQERIEMVTRDYADYVVPLLTSKERFKFVYNLDLDIKSNNDVKLSKDEKLLSLLHLMDVITDFQNDLLKQTQGTIKKLIEDINAYENLQ